MINCNVNHNKDIMILNIDRENTKKSVKGNKCKKPSIQDRIKQLDNCIENMLKEDEKPQVSIRKELSKTLLILSKEENFSDYETILLELSCKIESEKYHKSKWQNIKDMCASLNLFLSVKVKMMS